MSKLQPQQQPQLTKWSLTYPKLLYSWITSDMIKSFFISIFIACEFCCLHSRSLVVHWQNFLPLNPKESPRNSQNQTYYKYVSITFHCELSFPYPTITSDFIFVYLITIMMMSEMTCTSIIFSEGNISQASFVCGSS